jgi:hypothetical protein
VVVEVADVQAAAPDPLHDGEGDQPVRAGPPPAGVFAHHLDEGGERQQADQPEVDRRRPRAEVGEQDGADDADRVEHRAAPAHLAAAHLDAAVEVVGPVVAQPERGVLTPLDHDPRPTAR